MSDDGTLPQEGDTCRGLRAIAEVYGNGNHIGTDGARILREAAEELDRLRGIERRLTHVEESVALTVSSVEQAVDYTVEFIRSGHDPKRYYV